MNVFTFLLVAACLAHVTVGQVLNADFEEDPITGTSSPNYEYRVPSAWTGSEDGVVIAKNGNRPWGGLNSLNGAYYLVLQKRGRFIEQAGISGTTVGVRYSLSFLLSSRTGNNEAMRVFVDGAEVARFEDIPKAFRRVFVAFTAAGGGTTVRFENDCPEGIDLSVFIDDVTILPALLPFQLLNPSFEVDTITGDKRPNYEYRVPSAWTGSGAVVLALNGNTPWGGLHSSAGNHFCVIQTTGSYIEQTIEVEGGTTYEMNYLIAARPKYGTVEQVIVVVDGVEIKRFQPPEEFGPVRSTFTASSTKTITIRFQNTSPEGDHSVFVDNVVITKSFGAGGFVNFDSRCSTAP